MNLAPGPSEVSQEGAPSLPAPAPPPSMQAGASMFAEARRYLREVQTLWRERDMNPIYCACSPRTWRQPKRMLIIGWALGYLLLLGAAMASLIDSHSGSEMHGFATGVLFVAFAIIPVHCWACFWAFAWKRRTAEHLEELRMTTMPARAMAFGGAAWPVLMSVLVLAPAWALSLLPELASLTARFPQSTGESMLLVGLRQAVLLAFLTLTILIFVYAYISAARAWKWLYFVAAGLLSWVGLVYAFACALALAFTMYLGLGLQNANFTNETRIGLAMALLSTLVTAVLIPAYALVATCQDAGARFFELLLPEDVAQRRWFANYRLARREESEGLSKPPYRDLLREWSRGWKQDAVGYRVGLGVMLLLGLLAMLLGRQGGTIDKFLMGALGAPSVLSATVVMQCVAFLKRHKAQQGEPLPAISGGAPFTAFIFFLMPGAVWGLIVFVVYQAGEWFRISTTWQGHPWVDTPVVAQIAQIAMMSCFIALSAVCLASATCLALLPRSRVRRNSYVFIGFVTVCAVVLTTMMGKTFEAIRPLYTLGLQLVNDSAAVFAPLSILCALLLPVYGLRCVQRFHREDVTTTPRNTLTACYGGRSASAAREPVVSPPELPKESPHTQEPR